MQLISGAFVFLCTVIANACPNLAGEYEHTKFPWNGKIVVQQLGCENISLKFVRQLDGGQNWESSTNYKPNGQPFEGLYQATAAANVQSSVFHITNFVEGGISVVSYFGSQSDCGLSHTFNSINGKCHKIEQRLEYNQTLKSYVWRQIGNSVQGEIWNDDLFPLRKK